jgi:hypothetical protein
MTSVPSACFSDTHCQLVPANGSGSAWAGASTVGVGSTGAGGSAVNSLARRRSVGSTGSGASTVGAVRPADGSTVAASPAGGRAQLEPALRLWEWPRPRLGRAFRVRSDQRQHESSPGRAATMSSSLFHLSMHVCAIRRRIVSIWRILPQTYSDAHCVARCKQLIYGADEA